MHAWRTHEPEGRIDRRECYGWAVPATPALCTTLKGAFLIVGRRCHVRLHLDFVACFVTSARSSC